jgi:hypothetical protein
MKPVNCSEIVAEEPEGVSGTPRGSFWRRRVPSRMFLAGAGQRQLGVRREPSVAPLFFCGRLRAPSVESYLD